MERKYAQVFTSNNRVNLVGDESVGLPSSDPRVFCVNIETHAQHDTVCEGMFFDFANGLFTSVPTKEVQFPEAVATEFDILSAKLDYMIMLAEPVM